MNRNDLASRVAGKLGMKKVDAKEFVDLVVSIIENALVDGEDVTINNFGSFKIVTGKERVGRNPKTGETVAIPERKKVKFTPGRQLREKVK